MTTTNRIIRQALHIKYHGSTNHYPSRYSVTAGPGRKYYNYDWTGDANFVRSIAARYCEHYGWKYKNLHIGVIETGDYVAVLEI